jgi:hypothetical protein
MHISVVAFRAARTIPLLIGIGVDDNPSGVWWRNV